MGLCFHHASKRKIWDAEGAVVLGKIPRSLAFALDHAQWILVLEMDITGTMVASGDACSFENRKFLDINCVLV